MPKIWQLFKDLYLETIPSSIILLFLKSEAIASTAQEKLKSKI